ncbi:DUF6175 family protein [Marinospirillum perlucidum]|uniref:DUF6175 family protein n=1 Tax=Marinospirillum perlucidum TaxID=1982602 RepID=UPI000DF2E161|nr:DUF6175 family protein [Marinospirillum perlucidum]
MRTPIIVLLLALLLTACASAPESTVKPTDPPLSHQATLVESYSSTENLIRATGLGNNLAEARDDARKAAVWFALFGGSNALLNTDGQRQSFRNYEGEFWANAMRYINHESGLLSKRQEAGQSRIERSFRVDIAKLKEDLVARNILTSTQALAADLANPRITVIAEDPQGDARHAANVFSEYLQDRNYEVQVMDASENINEIVQQAATLEGNLDPMYLLALQTGSDIYIRVDAEVAERQIAGNRVAQSTVNATAYYTATASQLGAANGYSEERAIAGGAALTAEAANDAANKVLGQINRSWQREAARGKAFKVVVSAGPSVGDVSRNVHQMFNQVCNRVRRNAAGTTSFDYTVNCEGQADAFELLMDLQDNYQGPGRVFRVMDSGAFLVLRIGESESNSIIIE